MASHEVLDPRWRQLTEGKTLYEQDGIFIHVRIGDADEDVLTSGTLRIVEQSDLSGKKNQNVNANIIWRKTEETEYSLEHVHEWALINATVGYAVNNPRSEVHNSSVDVKPIVINVHNVKSFKCVWPLQSWAYISFMDTDGVNHPAMHFHIGNVNNFLETLQRFISIKRCKSDTNLFLVVEKNGKSKFQLAEEKRGSSGPLLMFIQDPYATTLGGFSKVTKFVIDRVVSDTSRISLPESNLGGIVSGLDVNQDEPGFELITKSDLIPVPDITRRDPLTEEEWLEHMDAEGRFINIDELKQKIFKGGITPALRREAWKFLLSYYNFNSTHTDRQEVRRKRIDDYFRMKLQWKTIDDEQEKRFVAFRDIKDQIEKDVRRTDRNHPFYEGNENANLDILFNVLMTHIMYNFDFSYTQGMHDLLSPLLMVMEDEVDAFWCFAGFMEKMCDYFEARYMDVGPQLRKLSLLLRFIDTALYDFLIGDANIFEGPIPPLDYLLPWLGLLFKREFKFPEVMKLWEVLWTGLPCKNFHLVFLLAILVTEREVLMENKLANDEVRQHIKSMTKNIPLEEMLIKAEGIYLQFANCSYLPRSIQTILNIEVDYASPEVVESGMADVIRTEGGIPIAKRNKTDCVLVGAAATQSPKSNGSSMDMSSIDVLSDLESEMQYQAGLDLQFT